MLSKAPDLTKYVTHHSLSTVFPSVQIIESTTGNVPCTVTTCTGHVFISPTAGTVAGRSLLLPVNPVVGCTISVKNHSGVEWTMVTTEENGLMFGADSVAVNAQTNVTFLGYLTLLGMKRAVWSS
jgi:hypothetical protein